jgi:hypothetical protein
MWALQVLQDGVKQRVAHFDGGGWRLVAEAKSPPQFRRVTMAVTSDAQLFIAGLSGLEAYDGQEWHRYRDTSGPSSVLASGLAPGKSDDVWVIGGIQHERVELDHFDGQHWTTHRDDRPRLDDNPIPSSIAVDDAGSVWWSSGSEIVRFDGESWRHFAPADGSPDGVIRVLASDQRGGMWAGSEGAGAGHWDGSRWTIVSIAQGLASDDIRAILVDNAGATWFGSLATGVSRWRHGRWTHYRQTDGLIADDVHGLTMDETGTVWAASTAGVSRFDGQRWTATASMVPFPGGAWGAMIAADHAGGVYYATGSTGVFRLADDVWSVVAAERAFSDEVVEDIDIDRRGHVWVTLFSGVEEFVPILPPTQAATCACAAARRLLPGVVLDDALANPARYEGWGQLLNPGQPVGPSNPLRTCLTLRNPNVPFSPTANGPVWRAGCP